jgi:hypothetical protein
VSNVETGRDGGDPETLEEKAGIAFTNGKRPCGRGSGYSIAPPPAASTAAASTAAAAATEVKPNAASATSMPPSAASAASSPVGKLYAGLGHSDVFLVEDIERRQANVGEFLLAKKKFITL